MSDLINVGDNAHVITPDDDHRDIGMVRNPRPVHKVPPFVTRNPGNYVPLGHKYLFNDEANSFHRFTKTFLGTATDSAGNTGNTNIDISDIVPSELGTVKGLEVRVYIQWHIDNNKMAAGLDYRAEVWAGFEFDQDVDTLQLVRWKEVVDANPGYALYQPAWSFLVTFPVLYKGATPFIRARWGWDVNRMSSNNSGFDLYFDHYRVGFYL